METFEIIVVLMFVAFIGLIFTGFPIAWILAGIALWFGVGAIALNELGVDTFLMRSFANFAIIVDRTWAVMENWVLVALPMFIFMGLMLDRSGVAENLMTNFVKVFGRLRGGLAITVVIIGVMLAASTGIVGASVVLLGTLAFPVMMQRGYSPALASGVVGASGTLGILIPPSIMLVIMADQLSMPVGDLFMGAVIPGLLMALLYIGYIVILAHVKPVLAPAPPPAGRLTAAEISQTLLAVVPPALLILAVLGSIFGGVATPTEASGMGALGATLLAALNRRFSLRMLAEVSRETMYTTSFIFGIFIGATAFAMVLRSLGGDDLVAHMLKSLPFGPEGLVIVILLMAFAAGFFLDWLEITLILLPLVAPVVKAAGLNDVWFVVLFAVCLQTSFMTPPVGFTLFYVKGIAPPAITTPHIYRGIIPFVIIQLLAVALVFSYPRLATWLPEQMYSVRR
ncbi:MAG TPA: TRAP transporter large permease subunit [Burkholderiaceae bacterium]|nr:TRAP transporter large permease subunit [Burkholderiaceae bacterium]